MKSQHQQKLRGRWRLENLQGTAVGSQVFSTYLTLPSGWMSPIGDTRAVQMGPLRFHLKPEC